MLPFKDMLILYNYFPYSSFLISWFRSWPWAFALTVAIRNSVRTVLVPSAFSWVFELTQSNFIHAYSILVLSEMVGAIIGRQGGTIRQITQQTRARYWTSFIMRFFKSFSNIVYPLNLILLIVLQSWCTSKR